MKKDLRGLNKYLNNNYKVTIKAGEGKVRFMTVEKMGVEFSHEKYTGENLNALLIHASKELLKNHKELLITEQGDNYPSNFLDKLILDGGTIKLIGDREKEIIGIGVKTRHSQKMEYIKTIEKGKNVLALFKDAENWAEDYAKETFNIIYENKKNEMMEEM